MEPLIGRSGASPPSRTTGANFLLLDRLALVCAYRGYSTRMPPYNYFSLSERS